MLFGLTSLALGNIFSANIMLRIKLPAMVPIFARDVKKSAMTVNLVKKKLKVMPTTKMTTEHIVIPIQIGNVQKIFCLLKLIKYFLIPKLANVSNSELHLLGFHTLV